jgi:5-methylthioadenosine/S-adenosylhomocysteine deaminase
MKTLLKNGWLIKNADTPPVREDMLVENDRIAAVLTPGGDTKADEIVDLEGRAVIPGFVQTHVHFCQVLFRGLGDDLSLLDWLRTRIWPYEAAHDEDSTYLSALLGSMELLAGGVTSVCVMESVRHADAAAKAIEETGIRAVFGKAMMDYTDTPEALGGMPAAFFETTQESVDRSLALLKKWHCRANGRIRYAFMPRGILTTSEEMLQELRHLSQEYDVLVHTHACETLPESLLVQQRRGLTEIKYLNKQGLTNDHLLLAHCLCIDDEDIAILAEKHVGVASCPLANLKLASGVAPLNRLQCAGVRLSLGSDGAPCNNNLDMFQEMKYASLLQKGLYHDPTLMPANDVFRIATEGGAQVLGLKDVVGTLDIGKKADFAVVDMDRRETAPAPLSVSTLVYSGNPQMVTDVMVDGHWVYRGGFFPHLDEDLIRHKAREAVKRVIDRVNH